MIKRNIPRTALIALAILIFITVVYAIAAANIVPVTLLTDQGSAVSASVMAPPECDRIRNSLETVVRCTGGNCNGTQGNDLTWAVLMRTTSKGKMATTVYWVVMETMTQ